MISTILNGRRNWLIQNGFVVAVVVPLWPFVTKGRQTTIMAMPEKLARFTNKSNHDNNAPPVLRFFAAACHGSTRSLRSNVAD